MDKARAGAVMMASGLDVPESDELEVKEGVSAETVEELVAKYGLPLVVKPVREGSTIGLTIARDADQVASGLVLAPRYDRRVQALRVAGRPQSNESGPPPPGQEGCRAFGRLRRHTHYYLRRHNQH